MSYCRWTNSRFIIISKFFNFMSLRLLQGPWNPTEFVRTDRRWCITLQSVQRKCWTGQMSIKRYLPLELILFLISFKFSSSNSIFNSHFSFYEITVRLGPFTFTYNRGHGECKNPVSNIDSCTEDSRLLLSFQACPDVSGTESTGMFLSFVKFNHREQPQ